MDKKEALRILNLIGVTTRSETELRYLQLGARIEILIADAKEPHLKEMYRETAKSLEEAYILLMRGKESKLLGMGTVVQEKWTEPPTSSGESSDILAQMRASLSEVEQIRSYLQRYASELEVQLSKAESLTKKFEAKKDAFDEAANEIGELRAHAKRNVHEIATHLENTKRLAVEMRIRKKELIDMMRAGKGNLLDLITGKTRANPPTYGSR